MGLFLGHSAWQKIGQVMGQCETHTVSNLLAHEWAIRSLSEHWEVLSFSERLVKSRTSKVQYFGNKQE